MPTVVSIVDKDLNISYFFDSAEEEENLSVFDEFKMVHEKENIFTNLFFESGLKNEFILLDEQLECKFSSDILLPPPELI